MWGAASGGRARAQCPIPPYPPSPQHRTTHAGSLNAFPQRLWSTQAVAFKI